MSPSPLLTLEILTPEGVSFKKENLTSVSVPLADGGTIGVRPGHAPIIGESVRGAVKFRTEGDQGQIEVLPGVMEIRDNLVMILTAGEVTQTSRMFSEPVETEFDRLMQTLVRKLVPDQE